MDDLDKIIRRVFEIPEDYLLEEIMGPGDVSGWDSMGAIALVNAVQEWYGIDFTLEEMSDFVSIENIRRLIQKKNGLE